MANICTICMANMDLVGRVHKCVGVSDAVRPVVATGAIRSAVEGHERAEQDDADHHREKQKLVHKGTYRYRDPEKRKAYMRAYMAKRRKAK